MPIPTEFEGADIEYMQADIFQADDFLSRDFGPEDRKTIAVTDEARRHIYESIGIPPDLSEVQTFAIIPASGESIQYRVILSPKRPDVYLIQERHRIRMGYHDWGYTGIYRLGEARNKRFRKTLNLPE